MNDLRNALHQLALQHGLSPSQHQALLALLGRQEPPQLAARGTMALRLIAALLIGFGLVLWVAANWADWGRVTQFALLQGVLAASLLGSWALPRFSAGLGLLALLALGALLAFFGQTYQTGADPWQLFALWALLALPLALAVRHDAVWAPWTLVASVAMALGVHAYAGQRWQLTAEVLPLQLAACLGLALLLLALAPWARPWHGAGLWAWRAQGLWALLLAGGWSLVALFDAGLHLQTLLLAAPLLLAVLLLWRQGDGVLLTCAAAALDLWLLAVLGHCLFDDSGGHGDWLGQVFLFGLGAALLLAVTVQLLLRRHREQA